MIAELRSLDQTLLFSDFTIVPPQIKRALSPYRCIQPAFTSYLITAKLSFDWADVQAEGGQTMAAGRLSAWHNEAATKMLRQIPLEMSGPRALQWPTGLWITVRPP